MINQAPRQECAPASNYTNITKLQYASHLFPLKNIWYWLAFSHIWYQGFYFWLVFRRGSKRKYVVQSQQAEWKTKTASCLPERWGMCEVLANTSTSLGKFIFLSTGLKIIPFYCGFAWSVSHGQRCLISIFTARMFSSPPALCQIALETIT